jgi:hypothetical protein
MRVSGRIAGAQIDFKSGKPLLTLEVNERHDFEMLVDELKDYERLSVEVKPFRQRRSLDSNNYAWKLITEIGNVLRANKEDVYLTMLKRYGQSDMISVLPCVPIHNYVKYYEEAGEGTVNGKVFKHYKVFKGSSEYDSREMSIFIDGVVSEAKELGIQTMTPNEIAEMKARWGE